MMAKVRDLRNFFNSSKKNTDGPTLVASAFDDVSQEELMIVEKEIKNSVQPRRQYNKNVPEAIKKEAGENTTEEKKIGEKY